MDIDQTNGNLFFVFYDRRNYSDNLTDVYIAYSDDGGNNITNKRISESPFNPNSGIFFGDYTNIVAHNNIIRPIWTRLHNNQLSIWTDVTPSPILFAGNGATQQVNNVINYPNPASAISYVSFKLHEEATVSINIYNAQGSMVYTVMENQTKGYGKYIIPMNLTEINLADGNYFCKLTVNGTSKTLKMIVVE
jgi:hypothetical protein